MKKVILESPFAGNVEENVQYARECVRDCLKHGEAPIASHLLFTQEGVLDDTKKCERALGIAAGLAWSNVADYVVVYTDKGISKGMQLGIEAHLRAGTKIVYRSLEDNTSVQVG